MENLKIKQFEDILKKEPTSKVFAPLSEAYRKNGKIEKALEISIKGVELNPNYNGGKLALALVLVDLNQDKDARKYLEEIILQEEDNILALKVLGKIFLKQKDFDSAYKIYSNIKLLKPEDQNSKKILEGLSQSKLDSHLKSEKRKSTSTHDLEKKIAFIDALIEQSKYKKAEDEIKMSLVTFSNNSELLKRKHYLQSLSKPSNLISKSSITTNYQDSLKKIKTLKNTLQRIEKRSKNDSNFGL